MFKILIASVASLFAVAGAAAASAQATPESTHGTWEVIRSEAHQMCAMVSPVANGGLVGITLGISDGGVMAASIAFANPQLPDLTGQQAQAVVVIDNQQLPATAEGMNHGFIIADSTPDLVNYLMVSTNFSVLTNRGIVVFAIESNTDFEAAGLALITCASRYSPRPVNDTTARQN